MTQRQRLAGIAGAFWLAFTSATAQPIRSAPPSASVAAKAAPSPSPQTLNVAGDSLFAPLTASPGDAVRGRAIVANRQVGLCLLCHTGPFPEERFQGNLAPDLSGTGSRWSEAQLRLRLVDASWINPQSIMPAYYRSDGLTRVAPAWQGRTLLNAQQIEDVLAFLQTLKN